MLIQAAEAKLPKTANLYIISNKSYAGDRSQLLGVTRETEKYFTKKLVKLSAMEYDLSQLDIVRSSVANDANVSIIVSVGYYGIESITKLKSDPALAKKIIAVHLSHQILDEGTLSHQQLVQKQADNFSGAEIIALPDYTLEGIIAKAQFTGVNTILLTTNGVAHNLRISDVEKDYDQFKEIFPSTNKYLAVILAGDVPEHGKYNCYTDQESAKLANYVSNLALKENILYYCLMDRVRANMIVWTTKSLPLIT